MTRRTTKHGRRQDNIIVQLQAVLATRGTVSFPLPADVAVDVSGDGESRWLHLRPSRRMTWKEYASLTAEQRAFYDIVEPGHRLHEPEKHAATERREKRTESGRTLSLVRGGHA